MSYMNRRGRIGRRRGRRINSSFQRKKRPYNRPLNRFRGRSQRSQVPGSRIGSRIGLNFKDAAESAVDIGGATFAGGLLFGPPGLAIGGALGGLAEYARHKWSKSPWWPGNWLDDL